MAITALPPAPSRADPANFADKADAWVAAMDTFTTEANALQADVNAKQLAAAANEANSLTNANNAALSASQASSSATTAANAASAPLWVTGTNYAQYAVVMSPVTLLSYRSKVALNPSTVDPSTDTSNWKLLNDVTSVQIVTTTSVIAVSGRHYVLTNVAATTVTGPATASEGDEYWVTVANDLETNSIARNSLTYMGLAENFNIDMRNVTVKFRYVNSTWRLI